MAKKKTEEVDLDKLLNSKDPDELISSLSFEQGIALLEELVDSLETGELALEDAMSSYEKGAGLVEKLRAQLDGAQKRLEELKLR